MRLGLEELGAGCPSADLSQFPSAPAGACCQNLNPGKEFPISSAEKGDSPFHLDRKY